jgi:radical SAM protein with 4Fe4S-binding SPASM domain
MSAQTALPHFVQIEPVGQCNLRCRMCPIQFRTDGAPGQPRAYMSFQVFCRLLDQFPEVTELQLQGLGEPLLHPDFFTMVRYAAQRGISVSTNTNLTVMSKRGAEECITSGLHTMHVSLDGASAEAYEAIRVRSSLSRVLRNLRRLTSAKARLQSALPDIRLVAVVMRRNLPELPELVRLAQREGIDSVSVQHLCHDFGEASLPGKYWPMRTFVDQETLLHEDPKRIEHYFEAARTAARDLGVNLRLPNVQPRPHAANVPGKNRCDWPWRGSYISYDGKAMPCCMVATPDRIHFGDMTKEGVANVWNNEAYRRFRQQLESDTPPDVCRSCAIYAGTF